MILDSVKFLGVAIMQQLEVDPGAMQDTLFR